jgi:phosphoglucomutase
MDETIQNVVIKFGTSGWRGILAEDFTVANVRRALTGISRYVAAQPAVNGKQHRVLVGRDPRFMGEKFVSISAEILGQHGIQPLVIDEVAPTPAISYAIQTLKTDGGINFTASHNPAEYNGIKFNTPDGAPSLVRVTKAIEQLVVDADRDGKPAPSARNLVEKVSVDVKAAFNKRLSEIVDCKLISKSRIKVIFDPLWGAGCGYSDEILRQAGVSVTTLHDTRDVLFGGHAPEPEGELLNQAREALKLTSAALCIATDGDADRFGIMDGDGTFLQPNYILALCFDYLVESRGWKNGVAKSVATTNLINALAEFHKVPLFETPVGFKYIGELIMQDKIVMGGEESAGMSILHHVPEKDGILAGLLCCEMVAQRKKSLGEQLKDLFVKVGSYYPCRDNFRLTAEVKETFTKKSQVSPAEFCGRKVAEVVRKDGLKLVLEDGAWVCYRLSGTEPVVRAYVEARNENDLPKLRQAAKDWVFEA